MALNEGHVRVDRICRARDRRRWNAWRLLAVAVVVANWPQSPWAAPRQAVATGDFLDSIGVVTTLPDRGQPLDKTIEMIRYGGFRWVRAGIEGLSDEGPTTLQTFLDLHREAGVRFSWGLGSGGTDIAKLVETGRVLAGVGALLAFEGNNEPNNWGVTYNGRPGGGGAHSWKPVAELQRDLYLAVKSDPQLAKYPVWSISEPGAQIDNVGLQFLTIPPGAPTLMPEGTTYADYANVHNYIYHPHSPGLANNKSWDATDPTAASRVDGLFGNFGQTWRAGFGVTRKRNSIRCRGSRLRLYPRDVEMLGRRLRQGARDGPHLESEVSPAVR